MLEKPVNILVVDDSVVYQKILSQVIRELPMATLVGIASNGRVALEMIEALKPDLVLMDHEMPEMNGLETLAIIKQKYPGIGVVMISGLNKRQAELTMQALECGALDFIPKPDSGGFLSGMAQIRDKLLPLLGLMKLRRSTARSAAIAAGKLPQATAKQVAHRVHFAKPPTHFNVIAIGSSMGGPEALGKIIPALPGDLDVPILLVQHMPPLFTTSLAKNLDNKSALQVKEAEEGEIVRNNVVHIAPGGRHMVVRRSGSGLQKQYRISLNQEPPEKSCRPSVNVLFRSIAAAYEGNVLAVILTGMGDDGADGVSALKVKGCYCISQNEASCVVYGMPRAIDENGLSDISIPALEISDFLVTKIHPQNR